ncbi:hypothetical protein HDV02_001695 [Globomyces sp. JEL0801]|nr:hypothetical protein HDV02_001695 [Globomyces sp. JEL0801]
MDINPSPHIHLNSLSPSALHSTNNSMLNRENGQRSPPYTQSSRQSQSYPMAQQTTSNNSRINPSVVVVQPHQSTNNNRFTTPITPNLPPQPRQTRRQPSILLRRTPTHNSHSMMPPDETADMVPESQLVSAMTLDGDEVPSHIPSEVLSTDTVYYQPGARPKTTNATQSFHLTYNIKNILLNTKKNLPTNTLKSILNAIDGSLVKEDRAVKVKEWLPGFHTVKWLEELNGTNVKRDKMKGVKEKNKEKKLEDLEWLKK